MKYFAGEEKELSNDGWWYDIGNKAIATTTEYAHSKGLSATGKPERWWLRSVGSSAFRVMIVISAGSVYAGGRVGLDGVGVRPALWISLKS